MPKVIFYRNKCIGCGVCQERQPELWRMSKKDGKATLLGAEKKKETFVLSLHQGFEERSRETAGACPAKIIQVV
jgi:ferredoxin